ncbi:MAG TPA: hypothetical protein VKS60_17035 [Stellaceae bacterium]|nr:hypothetical protein [Stellaceae bacterium]
MVSKRVVLWSALGVVLVGAIGGGIYGYHYWDQQREAAERKSVLDCADKQVGTEVGDAFDQSEIAKFENVKAVALVDVHETSFDRVPPRRHCAARVFGSDHSQRDVAYSVENAANDQFTIRLRILNVSAETPAAAKPDAAKPDAAAPPAASAPATPAADTPAPAPAKPD